MTAYANVNGESVIEGSLHVPNVGVWWADVVFEGEPSFEDSQSVTLNLGDLALTGSVDPSHNGTFGQQRRMRILAGAGGWGNLITAQHYHNDAGVLSRAVADDAARLVGESLGAFAPAADKIGIDYVRQAGPASRVLEEMIGGVAWWVGYDGVTVVGERTTSEAPLDAYEVLEFSPAESLVTLGVDDLTKIGIGSVFSNGLDAPLTAFEIEVVISSERARVKVWGGGTATGRGRLTATLVSIFEAVLRRRLFGKYRYRVVQMSADRVELQAVALAEGLPDVIPVAMKPGVSGAHAELTPGSVVLVEFTEGNRTLPLITAFAGKGEEGDAPEELDFSVMTTLRLGSDAATEGVTLGDSHKSWADGHKHLYQQATGSGVSGAIPLFSSTPVTGTPVSPVSDPAPDPSTKVKVE